jgi:group I intron endonuclease
MLIIYKTTNLVNGKIYVGKYSGNRKGYLGSGLWIKRAIKKYKLENFKRETLEICTKDNWAEREQYWILFLNARDPKIGYNIAIGGEGFLPGPGHPMFGKPHTEEWKQNLSNSRKGIGNPMFGKKQSLETIRLRIEARKGKPSGMKGKKHSEEAKRKIRENAKPLRGSAHPLFGKHPSLETIEKIRKSILNSPSRMAQVRQLGIDAKGRIKSEETRRKLSIANSGPNNPNYGKKLSEEHKRKIREHSNPRRGADHPLFGKHLSKEIIQKMILSKRGFKHTEETKRKMSEARRKRPGIPCSEETKAKISAGNKGKIISQEQRQKISIANKGKIISQQQREQASIAAKKQWELRRKNGWKSPRIGVPLSEETKAKISAGNKGEKNGFFGKKHKEETKKLLSEKLTGKKRSEEIRQNMSRVLRLRWQNKKDRTMSEEGRKNIKEAWRLRKERGEDKLSEETRAKMSKGQKLRWEREKIAKAA